MNRSLPVLLGMKQSKHITLQKARLATAYAPAAAQNKGLASKRGRQARCAKEMN